MFNKIFAKYFNTKNIIFTITLVIFLVFFVTCKDIALMFFASFVVACSINPLVDKLEKKIPRKLAACIILFLLMVIIIGTFIPVLLISAEEIKVFAISFPKYIDKIDDYILERPFFSHFDLSGLDLETVMASVSESSADIINHAINIGKNIGTAFVYLTVSIIIIFNMVIDKNILKTFYIKLFPSHMRKNAENIGNIISAKMGGYLVALAATMFGIFVVMFIGLSICKVDYALILALITGVLDIIPVIGPGLALIICLIATYETGLSAIISVLIVFSIAQLIENNFVRPYVFGKFLDLHPLVIFLFLFLSAKIIGVIGVIFAPAIAALFAVLFEELYLKQLD